MKLDKFRRRISKKSTAFDWIPQNTTENIVESSRNKKGARTTVRLFALL